MTTIQKNVLRFEKRPGRKIVVDGLLWRYRVGKVQRNIVAYSEDGQHRVFRFEDIFPPREPHVLDENGDFVLNHIPVTPAVMERVLRSPKD